MRKEYRQDDETRVLENPYEISKHLKYVIENGPERSVCSSIVGLQQIYQDFFDLYKKLLARSSKGTEEVGKGEKKTFTGNRLIKSKLIKQTGRI